MSAADWKNVALMVGGVVLSGLIALALGKVAGICVLGILLVVSIVMWKKGQRDEEDQRDFLKISSQSLAPGTTQEPNAAGNRSELLALRRLVGELSEEVGNYGPVRDLGSLRERLSQVERAAGTFGHDLSLRQAIRDVHHTLGWIISVKNNPERAADDGIDLRKQLETEYQHFLSEINRLL